MSFEINNGSLIKYHEEFCVREAVIPNGVTSIAEKAFYACYSLTRIVIPDSVISIGEKAFALCVGLRDIAIPSGVTNIPNECFYRCSSLNSMQIPESVTSIGDRAFGSCESLRNIVIPSGVTNIPNGCFCECRSLNSVQILESVTSIGKEAFYDCRSLKSLIIPEGVTTIGDNAFSNCVSLEKLSIPESLKKMGDNGFRENNDNIIELTICGYNLKIPPHCDLYIPEVRWFIIDGRYSDTINPNVKRLLAGQMYLKTARDDVEKYIKKNTLRVFRFLIDAGDYVTIKGLFECGRFVTEENILKLAEYSIEHTQNGGDVQIQTYILGYRSKYFPQLDLLNNLSI